jgi:hypothetical protein
VNRWIFFILLAVFCHFNAEASKTDSLLNSLASINNPYLVLNITSADCINCRLGGIKVLQQLKKADLADKIVLLSDTKKMSLYFQDNKDIYEGYRTIYNKELSDELAMGPSCTVCLVDKNNIRRWLFKNVDNDTLNMFINALNASSTSPLHSYKVRDSIFDNLNDVHFANNHVVLFDDKFQISLNYDLQTRRAEYSRADITDSAANNIYGILKSNGMSASAPASFVRQHLRFDALPMAMANSIDRNCGSLLFRLFQAKLDSITLPNGKRDLNVNFYTQAIVGCNELKNNNILNIGNYKEFLLLDTIRNNGKLYMASQNLNHQVKDGNYFIPFTSSYNAKTTVVEGRTVHTPTELAIFEYTANGNSKGKLKNVYPVSNYEGNARPDMFFRVDDKGIPVVVNNVRKNISKLKEGSNADFSSLSVSGESIIRVFDIDVANDQIRFVGTTSKNAFVKGVYEIKSGKTSFTKLKNNIVYTNMKINGNSILACKKELETNELIFDLFSF